MKKLKFILLLLPLAIFLNIYLSIPEDIHIAQNSEYFLKMNPFCRVGEKSVQATGGGDAFVTQTAEGAKINAKSSGKYAFDVKMFNFIPIKTVDVTISPEQSVIPCGSPIGIKIFSDGLLVVNVSNVTAPDGTEKSPAKDAGIKTGDRIISANGEKLNLSEDFSKIIASCENVVLSVVRGEECFDVSVSPIVSNDGEKRIGIWVRDSTAGVGTMTYYDPKNGTFAALGHGICDVDTGDMIIPRTGSISDCEIAYATKGEVGAPGELSGIFGSRTLGDITVNSPLGIYGKMKNSENLHNEGYMTVAPRFGVKTGEAYILCDVDGGGVSRYSIYIEEVSKSSEISNKGMVIRVTDPVLLEKTGGIVQGMSGSPIIQNNMLAGAVTHVFVNDPTRGYAIFSENMINLSLNLQ